MVGVFFAVILDYVVVAEARKGDLFARLLGLILRIQVNLAAVFVLYDGITGYAYAATAGKAKGWREVAFFDKQVYFADTYFTVKFIPNLLYRKIVFFFE